MLRGVDGSALREEERVSAFLRVGLLGVGFVALLLHFLVLRGRYNDLYSWWRLCLYSAFASRDSAGLSKRRDSLLPPTIPLYTPHHGMRNRQQLHGFAPPDIPRPPGVNVPAHHPAEIKPQDPPPIQVELLHPHWRLLAEKYGQRPGADPTTPAKLGERFQATGAVEPPQNDDAGAVSPAPDDAISRPPWRRPLQPQLGEPLRPSRRLSPAPRPPAPQPPTPQPSPLPAPELAVPAASGAETAVNEARVPSHGGASYEISWSTLHFGELVGEGAFGRVYRGRWRGTVVAIKVLVCSDTAQWHEGLVSEFQREVAVISALRHPNVCLFLGSVTAPDAPHSCLVTEFCANGSLWGLLHGGKGELREGGGLAPVDWTYLQRFVRDITCGFVYLHCCDPPILHRDLKSGNLLLDASWSVKLSDFGLSRLKSYTHTMTGGCGTFQWMAPEVLGAQRYTERADVFSFAVVVWELEVARLGRPSVPYARLSQIQAAVAVLQDGLRPTFPPNAAPKVVGLCHRCWAASPAHRPSFEQVLETIEAWGGLE